jgi:hypothetical protein
MAPVHTEHNGFRVRVLRLDIAGSREAWTSLASARRGAKVSREHLRFVARLECDPLEFVHGDMRTRIWGKARDALGFLGVLPFGLGHTT